MCEAPSTWRARMWVMLPRALSAEYKGLMAAPGTPNAVVTPSRSSTCTAASMALILGMSLLLAGWEGNADRDGAILSPNSKYDSGVGNQSLKYDGYRLG